jgi:ABC-type branched-subunit amino acid transport system substrate-binding protein
MTSGSDHLRVGACLSLSGRFARFGQQAARGLETWAALDGAAEVIVEDDRSDPDALEAAMHRIAGRCDVLLGPYSTLLMRRAGRVAAEWGHLVWNHGGSGDDVEAAHPGHVVSVLTPTSRYAEPFLRRLAGDPEPGQLWISHGRGSFGRQVAAGAEAAARRLGLATARIGPGDSLPSPGMSASWSLLCAGLFEEDIEQVQHARQLPHPPRHVCAVAAGVREFGQAVTDPGEVFGIAQWVPLRRRRPALGPGEREFLAAYAAGAGPMPDYPAVQAAAGAALAVHCARLAGTSREQLWSVAAGLETETLFGRFRIDDRGVQTAHETALVRWTADDPSELLPIAA